MGRLAGRSERFVLSGCELICGALFLAFAVWQTLKLNEAVPGAGAADMGTSGYFLAAGVAFYFFGVLLVSMGLRGIHRISGPRAA